MENIFTVDVNNDVTYGRGYVYSLKYHVVWCTKYRRKVFVGAIANDVSRYIKTTAHDLDIDVLAMELMPDHIHLLISCKPQTRLSDAVKVLKGNTARWAFLAHPELKEQLWGGHLWNPTYFVVTVSERSEEQIRHYINTQKTR